MVALGPGSYTGGAMGLTTNDLSSVRVPSGLRLTIYDLPDFQGEQLTITGQQYVSCLFTFSFPNSSDWNDKTSSFIISTGMCLT